MQSISTSSYNDLSIVNPVNGNNSLNNKNLNIKNIRINNVTSSRFISSDEDSYNTERRIYHITLKVTKDLIQNVAYYILKNNITNLNPTINQNIESNMNQNIDYINISFIKKSTLTVQNGWNITVRLYLYAYDINGNEIKGIPFTGNAFYYRIE